MIVALLVALALPLRPAFLPMRTAQDAAFATVAADYDGDVYRCHRVNRHHVRCDVRVRWREFGDYADGWAEVIKSPRTRHVRVDIPWL